MASAPLEERYRYSDLAELRDALRALHEALVHIDAARSESEAAEHSAKLWGGLSLAHWSMTEHFERSGRRYCLLHRNETDACRCHELTEREREVLSHAESGHSNKVIAYALRLSPSTISTLLNRALKRSHACFRRGLAEPIHPSLEVSIPARVASTRREPYLGFVGTVRIPREPLAKARITRISDRLVLLSVPIEAPLDATATGTLTAAEKAVVELTLRGLSNAAIATKRRCSPRTVANQLAAAYKKLDVGSRRELRARFGR